MITTSMNEKDIKKIVDELCAADRTLRGKERELVALVRELAAKPHVERDPDFKHTLRLQVLAKLSQQGMENRVAAAMSEGRRFIPRASSLIFAAIAMIAVASAAWLSFSTLHPQNKNNNIAMIPAASITRVGDRAFGPISAPQAMKTPAIARATAAPMSEMEETSGMASEGGEAASAKIQIMSASPASIVPSISPVPIAVTYVYQGKKFSQSDAAVDVLKKTTSTLSLGDVAAALGQAGFGSVGTSSFGNAAVTSLTFMQDQDFGYAVTVDLQGGNISIDPNAGRWPLDGAAVPVSLSSSSVLGIADQFLKDHAIPMANYGDPVVRISGTMPSVFYPEMVNGMAVYSMSGEKAGFTLEVNAGYGRVESVLGLSIQNYEASSYNAITDTAKIISLAEQEAENAAVPAGAAIRETGLGTPVRAYADEGSGLLVPALVFPVIGADAGASVVVPLVQN